MRHSGLHKQVTKLEGIVHVCTFPNLQIEVHGGYGGRMIGHSLTRHRNKIQWRDCHMCRRFLTYK